LQVHHSRFLFSLSVFLACLFLEGCSNSTPRSIDAAPGTGAPPVGSSPPPTQVQAPQLKQTLSGGGEGWLGSPAPAVADLDGDGKREILFPAYDGVLYAIHSDGQLFWKFSFADLGTRFATEPVIADLNNDETPEILFATYETETEKGALVVLNHLGTELVKVSLPGRGGMAAPTLADIDADGELEAIISLKDATAEGGIQIYSLRGSKGNRILWGSGRGNFFRNGDAT
jgi:hypothetical protein